MPGRVLIADDSLKIQKELTHLLEGLGVEVTTVSNGEHAVRQLATLNPDLVMADIFMPVRTGYEVCDYIKTRDEFAHTAVLLLVSKMEPYDEKEALRVRADGKVEKPFAGAEEAVLATVKKHLARVLTEKPAAPIDEFAAAVPATDEEASAAAAEPEPDMFATQPPPVSFDEQAEPMGFAEMVEAEAAPPEAPVAPVEAEPEEAVDLSQATLLTTADELMRRLKEAKAAQAAPAAQVFEEKTSIIEKPQLAEAWEMTGPEPGAPEIPPAGGEGWDSQWKGMEEEAAPAATIEEEAAPAAVEEEALPAAIEEEVAAPAELVTGRPFPPEEFAAAFGAATAEGEVELAPAEVEETPPVEAMATDEVVAAELGEALPGGPAAPAVEIDPVVVEEIVNRVLERLSPQVMEAVAREIVRPLAEALLREKLRG